MYQLTNTTSILRSDGVSIPNDPLNLDYVAYLQWLDDGNVVTPASPIISQPINEVQMRQARLALLQAGYYDAVDDAINAMTGASGKAAKIEWQVSNTLRRNHPLVASMGAMLGLTSSQLDALFALAASL